MKRYRTDVRDGTLFLERDDGWFAVGPMDDIVALVGGETYAVEYDEQERAAVWLDTDAEGVLRFDVRETVCETTFTDEFVAPIESIPADETDEQGYPCRAAVFANLLQAIWDSKGNLDVS